MRVHVLIRMNNKKSNRLHLLADHALGLDCQNDELGN